MNPTITLCVVCAAVAVLPHTASAGGDGDYASFRADVQVNLQALAFLRRLDAGGPVLTDLGSDVTKALELDPFAKRCASYSTLAPRGNRRSSDVDELLMSDPAQTCRLATSRMEIMKREVPKILAARRSMSTSSVTEARARIADGKPTTAAGLACARDASGCGGQLEDAGRIEEQLGLATTSSTGNAAGFAAAWKRAAAKRRIGTLHDASRERIVRDMLARQKIVPLATGLHASTDDVTKHGDIPVKRTRGVSVLVRVPGEPFCRSYMAYASADYVGRGRYGALYAEGFDLEEDTFLVSACK